ncbi:hypothetical protein F5880DRAFT_1619335 [Lentinula raphanica]|nr:hypothetical protein F5880DRAFT_1619335 [Lentinula raphanica]
MSRSVWAGNITPGESINLILSQDLCITNAALSRESSDFGRTSLMFSFMLNNGKISSPVTICTLMLGQTDQFSTGNLRLIKGGKYILQVEGPNSISLMGFYDAPFHQGTTSAVSLSRVSQHNEPSVMGLRPNIGPLRAEPVGRAEHMNTRTDTQGVRPCAEPVEAQAKSMKAQAEPLAKRAETVGTQGGTVGARGEVVEKLAEAQIVRAQTQNVGMRGQAESMEMQAKPVGAVVGLRPNIGSSLGVLWP